MSHGFFGAKLDSECPIVLADCVASLRENGLLYEGVFRIPGSAAIVKELKAEYNKEFNTKLHKDTKRVSVLQESSMGAGVHEIASLMKAFLKEIDGGLIPGRSAKQMTAVLKMQLPKEEEDKMLSKAIRAMPSPNRECLGFVVSFMRDIARFKKHNRMGVSNVVTCFAFCLMEPEKGGDQLSLVGATGTKIVNRLMTSDVKLYMPSKKTVVRNTRFKLQQVEQREKMKKEASMTLKKKKRYEGIEEQMQHISYNPGSGTKHAKEI